MKTQENAVKELMAENGFSLEPSGGNCEWYTKYQDNGFWWAITDQDGIDAPTNLTEEIIIGKYDLDGNEVFESFHFHDGLKIFFHNFTLL